MEDNKEQSQSRVDTKSLLAHFKKLEGERTQLDSIWDDWGGYIGAGLTLTMLLVYGVSRWHFERKSPSLTTT